MAYLFQKPISQVEAQRKMHLTLAEELLDYLWYFVKVLVVVLIAYLFVRDNVFRNFSVDGESMAPNYRPTDNVYINKIAKRIGDIKRGDVVVFKEPDDRCPRDTPPGSCYLIKRVIGLPGETIITENGSVVIQSKQFPDGKVLDESSYLPALTKTYADVRGESKRTSFGTVPNNKFFVMGDNRTNSTDSRTTQVGFIALDQVEGKEFYRDRVGFFTTPKYNISNN